MIFDKRPYLTTRTLFWLFAPLLVGAPAYAIAAHGFVTQTNYPSMFYMGQLHILITKITVCSTTRVPETSEMSFNSLTGNLSYTPDLFAPRFQSISDVEVPCDGLHLEVGSQVHVTGKLEQMKTVVADHISAYMEVMNQSFAGSAVAEEQSDSDKSISVSKHSLWIDGYPMIITPQTSLHFSSENAKPKYYLSRKYGTVGIHTIFTPHGKQHLTEFTFRPDSRVQYGATFNSSECMVATEITAWPNFIDTKERKYLNAFAAEVLPPDYGNQTSGKIYFPHIFKVGIFVSIVPSMPVQKWVSNVGRKAIPGYWLNTTGSGQGNIRFRFFVIKKSKYTDVLSRITHNDESKDVDDSGIIALPNGNILIPTAFLVHLKNSSQLAFLLSSAVASVIQQHAYLFASFNIQEAIRSTIKATMLMQEQQSLRLGIRQMYLAGYDIREAPYAWAVAQGKPVNNPVIDSKDPDKEIPWYAAYAFDYISKYYRDVDYSKLKRGEREYQQFLQELRKADPEAFAPQPQK